MNATRSEPAGPQRSLRILVVDDHTVVREGLQRLLEGSDPAWSVRLAGDGFEALEWLGREKIDVAIIDLSMPGMTGLDLLKRLRAEHAGVSVLVLSMHAEEQYAMRAFKAGAHGYITKDRAAAELVAAVRKAAAGGAYVSPLFAEHLALQLGGTEPGPAHARLSNRELDVLCRIVAGQRPTEIAQALHLSVKTVSTHKMRIMDKLQLDSVAALIRYGIEHRLGGVPAPVGLPPA
jgi:two-component system, NarL family, invasion response regulator UvrY